MECKLSGCHGHVENGVCLTCGFNQDKEPTGRSRELVITSARRLLQLADVSPSREDLTKAAETLRTVVPYNYDAWRLHADLLLNALNQLQTRELQPDASFTLLAIPLRENDLRDAAEDALRQCAHFAESNEKRTALVDEANRVRRSTWF